LFNISGNSAKINTKLFRLQLEKNEEKGFYLCLKSVKCPASSKENIQNPDRLDFEICGMSVTRRDVRTSPTAPQA
jgi:hypothetical protein